MFSLSPVRELEVRLGHGIRETEDGLMTAIARDNLAGQDVIDYAHAVQTFKNIAHQIVALGSAAQEGDHASLRDQTNPLDPFSSLDGNLSDFVSRLKYEEWGVVHQYESACKENPPDLHAIRRCACMAECIARCAMRMNRIVDPEWSPVKDRKRQGYGWC